MGILHLCCLPLLLPAAQAPPSEPPRQLPSKKLPPTSIFLTPFHRPAHERWPRPQPTLGSFRPPHTPPYPTFSLFPMSRSLRGMTYAQFFSSAKCRSNGYA